ncbi:enoyl-CoA hydratase/isomerase family protein [Tamlana fucoidanivorans]|uniref:Enoyl-CoA hydratase/isomerase family protein n=1 Tax=Allotamlana fucoidanivorans TaxID=2583814 RepID=A0A5C4SGS9_9FLAO|nr:enoyl-CoA hydratase/isomerase family protein [Tamlana fucoidanivorans]TNJ42185.1 enoyl-CoA hydratase/isomerase family protein [Tamlana fucoidanivorans]
MFEYSKNERLGIISLNKAPANSYDIHFFKEFSKLLKGIEKDKTIAVVLIKSAIPKFFCAGADIKVFSKNTPAQNQDMVVMANKVARKIASSSKIIIAFLNGHTLGGGLELAMACDIRIASNKPFLLGLPEVNLGLMPGNGGIPKLVQLVGSSRALELLVSGGTFSSTDAFNYGLVTHLFEEEDAEEKALAYAKKISLGPKKAMAAIKKTIRKGSGMRLKQFLNLEKRNVDKLYDTFDAKEGFQAFVEKREPNFE